MAREQEKLSKDVLAVLDKKTNDLRLVSEMNEQTGEFNTVSTAPGDRRRALSFDSRTVLGTFFENLRNQYGRPSDLGWSFFRIGTEKLDRILDSIIQVREGKDQDGSLAKEVSDYELNNEGRIAKFADRYKFEERELPWDQIQALGLNKEILLENQSMGDILKGRIPNKLVPLKHKVDGRWVDLGLGTISPILFSWRTLSIVYSTNNDASAEL